MKILDVDGQLHLTNDGKLEIVFLGTGTAFSRSNFQTNFLIIKGDTHILVDFGMTGPQALHALNRRAEDISVILPTHSHSDHIGGIEYLTLINRYSAVPQGRPKLTMITTSDYRPVLWDQSLRGGLEYNEMDSEGMRLSFDDLFDVHLCKQISSDGRLIYRTHFFGVDLELFHTNHIPGEAESATDAFITYGVFVDDRVFISGDTKFDEDLIDLYSDRSEVLFHDASLTRNAVHASVNELIALPESIRNRMYLMHYQDEATDADAAEFAGLTKRGTRYIFD
ncbi:MAG: MBL fold metallo-hydrolase [Ignavibacteria bacterium]|nr:MBL fold metallo-hydrolase [Ignavibacteria bacterium]